MNFFRFSLRFVVAAMLCWVGASSAVAQSSKPGNFEAGNACYAAGDFKAATRNYEMGIQNNTLSASLFYNLGNAYYRLGDKGRAILNYRRALALAPDHAEAAANLAFVGGDKGRGSVEKSPWWLAAPWAVAVLFWLGTAGLLVTLTSRRHRALGLGLMATGWALAAAGAVSIWLFAGDGGGNAARAVVIQEAAPALYSPADNSKVVTSLATGSEVRVLSEQGAWDYVLLADGTTRAWLAANNLESFVPRQ